MPKPEKVGAEPDFRPANAMLHTPTMEQGSFELTQRVGDDAIPLFDPAVVAAEADWGSVPAPPSQPFFDDRRLACQYLRLIDSCITQLKAQGPSRTCNESKEEAVTAA